MKKSGFTLAEILGVIVIIGILLTLLAPAIVNKLSSSKDKAEETQNKMIYAAASQYMTENRDNYRYGKRYCISLRELIDAGKLASPVNDVKTGKALDDAYSVEATLYSSGDVYFEKQKSDECNSNLPIIDFLVSPSGSS